MKLCFLGFGEAAFELAAGLKTEGFSELYAYDAMQDDKIFGPLIQERMKKAAVTPLSSPKALADAADNFFCLVPANYSVEAAEHIAPYLQPGSHYTDLTASAPDVKKKIAHIIAQAGGIFTDGAMLGALVTYHHKVPILMSGEGAEQVKLMMKPFGMNITVAGTQPGDASAIKLIRSIYMKGTAALVIETLQAATFFGVEDQVIPSLAETFDSKSFLETMDRLATGTSIHAQRRGAELSGSLQMLSDAGLDASMTKAAYEKHMMLAKINVREKLGGRAPQSWQEAIRLLSK